MKRITTCLLVFFIVLALVLPSVPVVSFAAESGTTVYCLTPNNWTECMVYWWGSSTNISWPGVSMTRGEDGLWFYDVPSDATHLIFNNGNGVQSIDLTMPTDDKILYQYASRTWTIKTEPGICYVAGTMNGWVPNDPAYQMTKLADGSYSLTFFLDAGNHELKVTDGSWNNSWGSPGAPNENYTFTTNNAGEVTVTFINTIVTITGDFLNVPEFYTVYCQTNFSADVLNVYWWGSSLENPEWPGIAMEQTETYIWTGYVPSDATGVVFSGNNGAQSVDMPAPECDGYFYSLNGTGYYVAGDFNNWSENNIAYYLYPQDDGTLSATFTISAGDHALKVTDGTWDNSWGWDIYNFPFTVLQDSLITVEFDSENELITIYGDYVQAYDCGEAVTVLCQIPDYVTNVQVLWYNQDSECDGTASMTKNKDGLWVAQIPSNAAFLRFFWNGLESQEQLVPPYSDHVFYFGDPVLFLSGDFNNWEPGDPAYQMISQNNGTSQLTFPIIAGNHALKITAGNWDASWGDGEDNCTFSVSADSEITVTVNYETREITISGEFVTQHLIIESVHAVGVAGLTGAEWNPALNQMSANGNVYTITFDNVQAGTYEYKFAANGTWFISWGAATEVQSGIAYDALFDGGNNMLTVTEDGSSVTLVLDLTDMDPVTGNGATCTAIVDAPSTGATISGSITSGGNTTDPVTVELWTADAEAAAYTVTTQGDAYSIAGVVAGTYTLKVSKLNHVTREYTISVGTDAVAQDVKIHQIGDVDGNGKINTGDVAKLNAHLKGTNKLTDEYMILCANVNGGSLNMGDTASLYAHIKGTKKLY